jgi:hypothetical protein
LDAISINSNSWDKERVRPTEVLLLSGGGCTSCDGFVSDAQERVGELDSEQKKHENKDSSPNR